MHGDKLVAMAWTQKEDNQGKVVVHARVWKANIICGKGLIPGWKPPPGERKNWGGASTMVAVGEGLFRGERSESRIDIRLCKEVRA